MAVKNSPVLAHFVPIMSSVTYSSEPFAAAGSQPLRHVFVLSVGPF